MLSRSLMIPSQLFASTNKNHRIVRMNGSCVFFWVSEFSKTSHRLLSWLGFAWLTLNPLSCRVLHNHCVSLMQSRFVPFVKILVVCCYHIPKCSGNSNSVRWTVRISFAWRPCNFRASAYFAILVFGAWVNKLCFPPAFFEIGFPGRCAEGSIAGGGKATSAGGTSVELEDPLVNLAVNGWSHSGNCVPHFARGRPQHVPASGRPELCSGVRFLAPLGPPRECENGIWWLTWMPFMRVPERKYRGWCFSIIKLEQTCPNQRHILLLLQSYE